jgi:predicted ATPase/DNA-binding winged helix-turn-helix (wHTH) protein
MTEPNSERFEFDAFRLDAAEHLLLRDGEPVPLEPKVFETLLVLIRHDRRLVGKEELMQAVWPDSFVEESNLTRNISVLRKALSPTGGGPQYIETVPKCGYRFVREVRVLRGARAAVDEVPRHNLPDQLTSFVGRDDEISEIERLLSSTRLLTLTGAAGCGKTRLALQVAAASLPRFEDGAWVVELAPLSEANLVTQTVATVLGIREGSTRSLRGSVVEHLQHRHILLVLDNCEHLIGACAELAEALVRGAPHLRILATSREGLGISGETVRYVPPLSLPDTSRSLSPEALLEFEAARLFVERATAVDPSFTIDLHNVATIADICHRLDGMPLAIELAAARVNVLSVEQINTRLDDRFALLTGGSRTSVARQRTLEGTVDWSYDLLSETERRVLCELSVFSGGCSLDAAEEVCSGDGVERGEVLDLLSHLVGKSLVVVENGGRGERRLSIPVSCQDAFRARCMVGVTPRIAT